MRNRSCRRSQKHPRRLKLKLHQSRLEVRPWDCGSPGCVPARLLHHPGHQGHSCKTKGPQGPLDPPTQSPRAGTQRVYAWGELSSSFQCMIPSTEKQGWALASVWFLKLSSPSSSQGPVPQRRPLSPGSHGSARKGWHRLGRERHYSAQAAATKYHRLGNLNNRKAFWWFLFLGFCFVFMILEARSLRSRCWWGWFLRRFLPLACRWWCGPQSVCLCPNLLLL